MISNGNRPCQIIDSIRVGACTLLFSSIIGSVVDAQPKNTIVANITVGNFPSAVAVTPDNAYVYVANNYDNTVSKINTATNTVIATINAGTAPLSVAVTPDGSTLYVADWVGKASVINTSTDTMVASVSTGSISLSLAVSPDGKSVYACFYYGIKVINASNHRITATIPVSYPIEPRQILFNPNNRVAYALCYDGVTGGTQQINQGGILQINTRTLRKKKLLWKQLPDATTVAASPDGSKLYIVDLDWKSVPIHHNLVIFDTASQQIETTVPLDPSLYTPIVSAITPDGKYLYLANNVDTVLMVNTATNTVDALIHVPIQPQAIAIAPNGNYAYVATSVGDSPPGSVIVIDISPN